MSDSNFGLGVVLYNPSDENISSIKKILSSKLFDYAYIYDNSKVKGDYFLEFKKAFYIFRGKNDGLAIPYNYMIDQCSETGIDYLCLLDQDSCYKRNEIIKMINFIDSNKDFFENVAIIAPRVHKLNSKIRFTNKVLSEAFYAINSGSFLNIDCIKKMKIRYDEKIFIDGLDYDFGWSIKESKKKVLIYEKSILVQNFGYSNNNSKFSKHEKERYYLIAHNRKYIFKKHMGNILGTFFSFLNNVILLVRILIHEERKMDKVRFCLIGMLSDESTYIV